MMTAKMSELSKTFANRNIQLVSFSVDPDNDTPQALKDYAKMWQADGSRWHFLRTQKATLAATAAGMKTFVQQPDANTPIQHSSIFILCDGEGKVRGVYDSLDASAMQHLVINALSLAGVPAAEMPKANAAWSMPETDTSETDRKSENNPGLVLYTSHGCVACHAQERVAPALSHLMGKSVLLDDGRMVTVDAAYLRESILDPNAKVVAGYSHMMPSYRGQLTDGELDQLVSYIESLGADDSASQTTASTPPAGPGQPVGRAQ